MDIIDRFYYFDTEENKSSKNEEENLKEIFSEFIRLVSHGLITIKTLNLIIEKSTRNVYEMLKDMTQEDTVDISFIDMKKEIIQNVKNIITNKKELHDMFVKQGISVDYITESVVNENVEAFEKLYKEAVRNIMIGKFKFINVYFSRVKHFYSYTTNMYLTSIIDGLNTLMFSTLLNFANFVIFKFCFIYESKGTVFELYPLHKHKKALGYEEDIIVKINTKKVKSHKDRDEWEWTITMEENYQLIKAFFNIRSLDYGDERFRRCFSKLFENKEVLLNLPFQRLTYAYEEFANRIIDSDDMIVKEITEMIVKEMFENMVKNVFIVKVFKKRTPNDVRYLVAYTENIYNVNEDKEVNFDKVLEDYSSSQNNLAVLFNTECFENARSFFVIEKNYDEFIEQLKKEVIQRYLITTSSKKDVEVIKKEVDELIETYLLRRSNSIYKDSTTWKTMKKNVLYRITLTDSSFQMFKEMLEKNVRYEKLKEKSLELNER